MRGEGRGGSGALATTRSEEGGAQPTEDERGGGNRGGKRGGGGGEEGEAVGVGERETRRANQTIGTAGCSNSVGDGPAGDAGSPGDGDGHHGMVLLACKDERMCMQLRDVLEFGPEAVRAGGSGF